MRYSDQTFAGPARRLREMLYHAVNGVRSGIPLCCVSYFVAEHWRGGDTIGHDADIRRGFVDPIEYVRCDKCFERDRRVTIRRNGCIWYGLWR